MACASEFRGRFEPFVSDANQSIAIQLVCNENDIKDDLKGDTNGDKTTDPLIQEFTPEFCHQLFGDNESIFGYKALKVKLYYSSAKLNSYLSISFSEKVTKDETNGIEADDVLKIIVDKLEVQMCRSMDEFLSLLSKENQFKPYGQLIDKFSVDSNKEDKQLSHFEIYSTDISVPGFEAYHQRMQTFLLWFIDAASYIDVDDERWQYFVIYEKRSLNPSLTNGHSVDSEDVLYCFVGYATVYRYYSYPERIRPRISQFLILPPYQKRGLGARLLDSIYTIYKNDVKVFDITVEDPSDNFIRIRDFVDTKNCQKLDSFKTENLKLGWNEEMAIEAQKVLKLSKRQTRRVYEILRFRCTDRSKADEYKGFRLDVKQRLNSPLQKQIIDYQKIEKLKKFPEQELALIRQTTIPPLEIRVEQLDKQYKELEDQYQHTIERLAKT